MKRKEFSISIMLGDKRHDLDEELSINLHELSRELAEQPSRFAYWAAMEAEARHAYDEKKRLFDVKRYEVAGELRTASRADGSSTSMNGQKKKSEKLIEQEVYLDSRVKAHQIDMHDAKRELDYLKAMVTSFEQRMQSLRSIGARERAMLQGLDLTVNDDGKSYGNRNYYENDDTFYNHTNQSREDMIREVTSDVEPKGSRKFGKKNKK